MHLMRTWLAVTVFSGLLFSTLPCLAEDAEAQPMLRHIVLFKFKDTTSEAEVKEIVDAFAALKDKIDVIAAYEAGTDISPEKKAKGFTHCFVVSFKTEADRDAYLPHEEHQKFVKMLGGKLDDVLVFDFWAK